MNPIIKESVHRLRRLGNAKAENVISLKARQFGITGSIEWLFLRKLLKVAYTDKQ